MLEAIAYGHKGRIAHRDIKPKNILVTDEGNVKLADYGIAKLLDNGGSWAQVSGHTFRFDRTPGYTPAKPEEERGIRVNVVSPTATATRPMLQFFGENPEIEEAVLKGIPLGRLARLEEVARSVLLLASKDSSFVAGHELFVDGGVAAV